MSNPSPFRLFRAFRARPRLLVSILLGLTVFFLTPGDWLGVTRGLVAWDAAVFFYLILVVRLAQSANLQKTRMRAKMQDDGAVTTLLLSITAAAMCFVAIAFELAALKDLHGSEKFYHAILVGCTIPMAWSFIHSMFALHYAHEFYDPDEDSAGGLEFPGKEAPSYWDFIYFSFIVGTSGQTADVSISSPYMRKIALLHCTLAFFFNLFTLGLSINVASSLI